MRILKCWGKISKKQAEDINRRREKGILLKITPSRDKPRLTDLTELLKPACIPKKTSLKDELLFWKTGSMNSFEIVSTEKRAHFLLWSENRHDSNRLKNTLNAHYPNARITEAAGPLITVREGDYVSGGVLEPPLIDGIRGLKEYPVDPMNVLLETLSSIQSTCIIQVLFRPLMLNWMIKQQLKQLKGINKFNLAEDRFGAFVRYCSISRFPLTSYRSARHIGDYLKTISKKGAKAKLAKTIPFANPVKVLKDTLSRRYPLLLASKFICRPSALSTLIHLPSEYQGAGIQQAYPSFPPPENQREEERITIGNIVYRGEKQEPSGLSESDIMHSIYIVGGSGTGKTVLLINLSEKLLKRGYCVHVVDFHGDLSDDIIRTIEPEYLDNIYLFDPTRFLFSINPFGIHPSIQGYERDIIMEKLIGETAELLKTQFGSVYWGPSSHRLCSDALRLAYRNKKNLTYIDIYNILEGRGDLANKPEVKNFINELKKLPPERTESVKNKLSNFVKHPMIRSIFCQQSSVDFRELTKPSRMVLWRLPKGVLSSFNMTLIASSIVTKLWFHVISRSRENRNPIILIVDEFQNVFSGGMTMMDTMLSEQRKFGLSQILSHQTVSQIPREVHSTVLSNCPTKLLFRESSDGSRILGRNIDPKNFGRIVDALVHLPNGSALIKKGSSFGEPVKPVYQIETFGPPEDKHNDIEAVIERMKDRCGVPVLEVPSMGEEEASPDVIDLLKIVYELEDKNVEATVGRTLTEYRNIIPHLKGSRLSSICDIAQSSGLIDRQIVKQEGRGRPKIILSLTEKGRKEIGIGIEMGGRKGGADLHRTIILKLAERLRTEGYHTEIPRQAGTKNQPDLLTYRRSETGGWKEETAWEVETNPAKHPDQVRKNMMKAINSGREIVFVVLDEKGKENLKEVLGKQGKGIKVGVFDFDKDFLDI